MWKYKTRNPEHVFFAADERRYTPMTEKRHSQTTEGPAAVLIRQ
jgi:hypothetical protein